MSRRMIFSFLILVNIIPLGLSYDSLSINCLLSNIAIDANNGKTIDIKSPIVNVTYNRDSLKLYLYPGTKSVNLFINESLISVKSSENIGNTNLEFENHEKQHEIIAIANIANISDYNVGLTDCEFFVLDKTTDSFHNELPATKLIYKAIEECLKKHLCKSIGPIRHDDIVRAKNSPRDFGSFSILSKALQTTFPKMIPAKLNNSNEPKKRQMNLVDATDSIVKMVADGYRMTTKGIIQIPDVKHGIYSASKGTFSGLAGLVRVENYAVRVSPPTENPQVFSFTFGIQEANVIYEDYHVLRLLPVVGSLCADVSNVMFNAVVAMDFSREHCSASLQDFTLNSKGTSKTYTCGRLSFFTNSLMRWFVNVWDNEILIHVQNQVQRTMSAYISDKFDCEIFRPRV